MKKTVIIISLLMIFSLTSCNRIIGGAILENFGMEFTSQIEMMEECLDIDLDDLNDSDTLDERIKRTELVLQELQQIKKGLLQNLFI